MSDNSNSEMLTKKFDKVKKQMDNIEFGVGVLASALLLLVLQSSSPWVFKFSLGGMLLTLIIKMVIIALINHPFGKKIN